MVRIFKLIEPLRLEKGRVCNLRPQKARTLGLVFSGQFWQGGGVIDLCLRSGCEDASISERDEAQITTNPMSFPAPSV